jgi:LPPG:FO 2-phospho-L-lactate transferase
LTIGISHRPHQSPKRYLALCGGVGGSKLALGLSHVLPPDQLTIVVNTGDDFEHLGLLICPDIDTVIYTLAGLVHPAQGWGRDDDSFAALDTIERLGGETWFRLGDKDIGLQLMRRLLLDEGLSLSDVTARIAEQLGIAHTITPMTDDAVRTSLDTAGGTMAFQHYFVRERCVPEVTNIRYSGAETARPSSKLTQTLADPHLSGIIICPSNPYLSIDPILALPGIRRMLADTIVPVVAVAPLVDGQAIKGPTVKIMRELAVEPSAATIACHYADFLDGYVIDTTDRTAVPGIKVTSFDIVMNTLADKIALARHCIAFSDELARRS